MKRKLVSVVLCSTMALTLLAGCGSSATTTSGDATASEDPATEAETTAATTASGSGSIRLVNGKIEVDSQLKDLAAKYKEETGVDVTEAEGGYAFSYKRVNPEEKNNYFVDIYKFILDFDESDVKTQEEEVSGFAIADIKEIKRYADQGIFLHYESIRQVFEG